MFNVAMLFVAIRHGPWTGLRRDVFRVNRGLDLSPAVGDDEACSKDQLTVFRMTIETWFCARMNSSIIMLIFHV